MEGRGEKLEVTGSESNDLVLAKLLSSGDDLAEAKALQKCEDSSDGDDDELEVDENGRLILMRNMPKADVAEAEWTELVRKKDEYAHQALATIDRLFSVSKKKGYTGPCPLSAQKMRSDMVYIEDAGCVVCAAASGEGEAGPVP
jgi:hypothetical protein